MNRAVKSSDVTTPPSDGPVGPGGAALPPGVLPVQRPRRSRAAGTDDLARAFARSLPHGCLLVFDRDLRCTLADGTALASLGLDRAVLEGGVLPAALLPTLAAELEPHCHGALSGRTTSWELRAGRRSFRMTVGPVPDSAGWVASGMVVALDTTEERRTVATWAALHRNALDVARKAPLGEIAANVAGALVEVFGVDAASVVRLTSPGTALVVARAPEPWRGIPDVLTLRRGDTSATGLALLNGEPSLVTYPGEGRGLAAQLFDAGIRVGAAAPVRSNGHVWGAIALSSADPDGIDQQMADRLASFAEVVELSLDNSEEWNALARDAMTDDLTGLTNRRSFNEHLRLELDRAHRLGRPLSVGIVDIDHFKDVNDSFGHPVGDRALVELADRLRSVSRGGELLARFGGEEFAWVMPETDLDAAARAGERLREAVAQHAFSQIGHLTVSVGVSCLHDVTQDDELVPAADQALYLAKRNGRNRVERFEPT